MKRTFGEHLRQYRRDSRDPEYGGSLTQQRLAELIGDRAGDEGYPTPATVSYWEAGRNLPDGIKRRNTLVAMIYVFTRYGRLQSVDEANQFLAAGKYASLDDQEQAQIWGTPDTGKPEQAGATSRTVSSSGDKSSRSGLFHRSDSDGAGVGLGDATDKAPPASGRNGLFTVRGELGNEIGRGETVWGLDALVKGTLSDRLSKPGSAPRPPALIIGREDDLRALKNLLGLEHRRASAAPVKVLTSRWHSSSDGEKSWLATLRGWPGVGKTTLAAAFAYDSEVISAFPDGTLWVSLGQTPNVLSEMITWGCALGAEMGHAKTIEEASAQLAALLRHKQMLLIIDDAWKTSHALPFLVGGPGCATLITTRDNSVARSLAPTPGDIYRLDVLSEEKALELLQILAPFVVSKFPEDSLVLVKELEGLPLAIQVAGHLLQAEVGMGFSVVDLLTELREGARLLAAQSPSDQTDVTKETPPTVAALLQKSTDHLDPQIRDCFAYLGPFAPKPATFDLAAMQAVWQVDDPKPIARILVDRGLLESVPETGRFQMHALLVMHAKSLLTPN